MAFSGTLYFDSFRAFCFMYKIDTSYTRFWNCNYIIYNCIYFIRLQRLDYSQLYNYVLIYLWASIADRADKVKNKNKSLAATMLIYMTPEDRVATHQSHLSEFAPMVIVPSLLFSRTNSLATPTHKETRAFSLFDKAFPSQPPTRVGEFLGAARLMLRILALPELNFPRWPVAELCSRRCLSWEAEKESTLFPE